jgi:hypothetical protein
MAEIQLPHASLFSYADIPASYQHRGLAQQVLAHKLAKLNKQLDKLLGVYQAEIDAITVMRQQQQQLEQRIKRLSPSSSRKAALQAEAKQFVAKLKLAERSLMSSKIVLEISKIQRELKQISYDINLSA